MASELVEGYEEFLHGNPYRDRKVVLGQDLLDRGEITEVSYPKTVFIMLRWKHFEPNARKLGLPFYCFCSAMGRADVRGISWQ
jgi:hypothetical protein